VTGVYVGDGLVDPVEGMNWREGFTGQSACAACDQWLIDALPASGLWDRMYTRGPEYPMTPSDVWGLTLEW
jgi:hypothetical protein